VPERDALAYKEQKELPKVYKPRTSLTLVIVQGTLDTKTPRENTEQLVEFLRWAGTEVLYKEVQGAPHAFDIPAVQSEQGQEYAID